MWGLLRPWGTADTYWTALWATAVSVIISPLLQVLLRGKLSSEKGFLLILSTSNALPSIVYAIRSYTLGYRNGLILLTACMAMYVLGLILLLFNRRQVLWYGGVGLGELLIMAVWRMMLYE